MSVFLSLTKLYLKSFYNLPGKKAPGAQFNLKATLKTVGIVVLVLLVVADVGFLFVATNMVMYEALAPAGLQGILLLNVAVMATVLTLVVGFLTALSTYFLNDMELQFLSMPVKPRALFGAKFTAVYVSEAAFSLFFMASAMVIFGIKENPHPLMYLWGTLAGLLLPLPALAAAYLIQVPLLSIARFLKNKQTILMIGGVLGLVLALGFNFYYQSALAHVSDPEWVASNMAGPDSLISRMGQAYPPALYTWRALSYPATLDAGLSILMLALTCLALPALAVLVLPKAYASSLIGFNEAHLKKLGAAASTAFIAAKLRRGQAFWSLVKREIRTMNREPLYLLNGPFIIVLMPVIIGIMIVAQGDVLLSDPDLAGLMAMLRGGSGAAIAGLAGVFLASSTSISCTALSRDSKALPYIKSLPVSAGEYMLAKLVHGLFFATFGAVMGVGLIGYAIRLEPADIAAALAVAIGMSFLINLLGLWLDTANPRLKWDNPIAAMKQNPNAVILILGAMGLAGGAGFLTFKLALDRWQLAFWFGAVPAILFGILLSSYPRYAAKKLAAIEA